MEAARAGIARPSVLDARRDPRRYSDAHFQRDALNGGIVHVALQEVGGDVKAAYVVTVNIFFSHTHTQPSCISCWSWLGVGDVFM